MPIDHQDHNQPVSSTTSVDRPAGPPPTAPHPQDRLQQLPVHRTDRAPLFVHRTPLGRPRSPSLQHALPMPSPARHPQRPSQRQHPLPSGPTLHPGSTFPSNPPLRPGSTSTPDRPHHPLRTNQRDRQYEPTPFQHRTLLVPLILIATFLLAIWFGMSQSSSPALRSGSTPARPSPQPFHTPHLLADDPSRSPQQAPQLDPHGRTGKPPSSPPQGSLPTPFQPLLVEPPLAEPPTRSMGQPPPVPAMPLSHAPDSQALQPPHQPSAPMSPGARPSAQTPPHQPQPPANRMSRDSSPPTIQQRLHSRTPTHPPALATRPGASPAATRRAPPAVQALGPHPAAIQALSARSLAVQTPGPHALGSHALGSHALGSHALGPHALGPHALGARVLDLHALAARAPARAPAIQAPAVQSSAVQTLALRTPAAQAPAPRAPAWGWPLTGNPRILRPFNPPPVPWLSGHRGVDLAAPQGTPVYAAGPGTVAYAAPLAGRGVVSIVHTNGMRTTYLPVRASVRRGDVVATGTQVGVIEGLVSHCRESCLHWGLIQDHRYLDPLLLVGRGQVRLLPFWVFPSGSTG
ncbi:peptidoglycan DD-metalloendopeptidase family protein [Nonomuraea sp. NPDC050310]|uniref:M23 family metallopeptidase n=1 Tax=Nonomuraea sp. NPDC050310 TaxID=3154935 RepID=UPI0033CA0763